MTEIDQFLQQYGYFAIFGLLMLGIVGPLIPDETILVISGVFVHRGQLQFFPAVLVACAGSMCGITMSYGVGLYVFGWLERRSKAVSRFAANHLARAEQWFLRFGKWALFFGYFVVGVRHFTALFAGISRLPYREFAPAAYSGAVAWVTIFVSIGYFAGESWTKVSGSVDRAILIFTLLLAGAAIVWVRLRRGNKAS